MKQRDATGWLCVGLLVLALVGGCGRDGFSQTPGLDVVGGDADDRGGDESSDADEGSDGDDGDLGADGDDPIVPGDTIVPGPGREGCTSEVGLLACYELDGSLDDSGPNALHLEGSGVSYVADGALGSALRVGAASDLAAPISGLLTAPSSFTIEGWVRLRSTPSTRMVVADHQYRLGVFIQSSGGVRCTVYPVVTTTDSAPLALDRWTHVACTFDGVEMRSYVDGVLANAENVAGTPDGTGNAMHVGEDSPSGGEELDGDIDVLRLWDHPRGPAQICAAAGAASCGD